MRGIQYCTGEFSFIVLLSSSDSQVNRDPAPSYDIRSLSIQVFVKLRTTRYRICDREFDVKYC